MKRSGLLIIEGGLYRCCVHTIKQWVEEDPSAEVVEGEKITCRYEAGALGWHDPDYPLICLPSAVRPR